jgi:Flp pilus assembly pilin Flp
MIVGWVRDHVSDKDDTGASLVEYALLIAIGALTFLGTSVSHTLNNVANAINNP